MDGYAPQFSFKPIRNPHLHLTGFYKAKLVDLPGEELFLWSPPPLGRFDIRKVAFYTGGSFNNEEGCFKWPRVWKYDEHEKVDVQGDIMVMAFLNNCIENPIVFPSIVPFQTDAFFESMYEDWESGKFPIKERYYSDNFYYRAKNDKREVTVKEKDGEIDVHFNGSHTIKMKEGEVNIGGDATEPIPLGNELVSALKDIVNLISTIIYTVDVSKAVTVQPDISSQARIQNLLLTFNKILSKTGKVK